MLKKYYDYKVVQPTYPVTSFQWDFLAKKLIYIYNEQQYGSHPHHLGILGGFTLDHQSVSVLDFGCLNTEHEWEPRWKCLSRPRSSYTTTNAHNDRLLVLYGKKNWGLNVLENWRNLYHSEDFRLITKTINELFKNQYNLNLVLQEEYEKLLVLLFERLGLFFLHMIPHKDAHKNGIIYLSLRAACFIKRSLVNPRYSEPAFDAPEKFWSDDRPPELHFLWDLLFKTAVSFYTPEEILKVLLTGDYSDAEEFITISPDSSLVTTALPYNADTEANNEWLWQLEWSHLDTIKRLIDLIDQPILKYASDSFKVRFHNFKTLWSWIKRLQSDPNNIDLWIDIIQFSYNNGFNILNNYTYAPILITPAEDLFKPEPKWDKINEPNFINKYCTEEDFYEILEVKRKLKASDKADNNGYEMEVFWQGAVFDESWQEFKVIETTLRYKHDILKDTLNIINNN